MSPEGDRPAARIDADVAARLADAMFALSSPSRIQIIGCLLDGPRSVSELTAELGMEQSAVSHQLRILRDHGLASVERGNSTDRRTRLYALQDEHVASFVEEALLHVQRRSTSLRPVRGRQRRHGLG